ncbi:MAG: PDZ domain-containing protein [Planctomycetes bacterium]|nr:PDZ domain-containing protein [Planctomycetota bacterium]
MGLYLIAATSGWLELSNYWSALQVVLGVGFVIFVHELGHFLVAKACGVKCEKFYVGFDIPIWKFPRTLFKFQWGETEYGVGIIPLGGYVKMLGQHDDPREAEAEAERARGTPSGALNPRSYMAKSVPQRMAIISAGVIMNVIFAVVLAAIAFRNGVPYQPCIIEATVPGDPAWLAGIDTGDKIVQIHKQASPSDHLRYDKDLVTNVILGRDQPLDLLIEHPDKQRQWYSIVPTKRLMQRELDRTTIGVIIPNSLKIGGLPQKARLRERRIPNIHELRQGDRIVGVDGQPISSPSELEALQARHIREALRLSIERRDSTGSAGSETVEFVVPPSPMRWLGFTVTMTPIIGIQPGSPAAEAGIQAGDRIVSIDGELPGDPLTLPQRIADRVGSEIVVEVARGETSGEETIFKLPVTPRAPRHCNYYTPNCAIGLDTLGVAYRTENVISHVEPGTPAAEAGLQPGDVIESVAFVAANEQRKKEEEARFKSFETPFELIKDHSDWPYVQELIQDLLPDSQVNMEVTRGESRKPFKLAVVDGTGFNEDRRLPLEALTAIHKADSWAEAMPLAVRETLEQLTGVVRFLKSLVGGRLSVKNLGGPGTIALVAFSEASRSPARLLIFLTFLSANLAVLNILPIPALDGGHLAFLTWEGIVRRPPNPTVQGWITLVGVGLLLLMMVTVIGLDISRFWN